MARLPIVGSDDGTWGTTLNEYLSVEHNADGTHNINSLSDYQNVVVIDSGGNGDYTTLGAAVTAGVFSTASSTNRFNVQLFGNIVETVNADITLPEGVDISGSFGHRWSLYSGSRHLVPAGNSYIFGVNLVSGVVDTPGSGKTLQCFNCYLPTLGGYGSGTIEAIGSLIQSVAFQNVSTIFLKSSKLVGEVGTSGASAGVGHLILRNSYWEASTLANLNDYSVTFSIYNSSLVASSIGLVSGIGSSLTIINSSVINTSSTNNRTAIEMDANYPVYIHNSYIACPNSTIDFYGGALVLVAPITTVSITNSVFVSPTTGCSIYNAGDAWANAPIYRCVFKGGLTGITPAAGTAVGSNISF